MKMSDLRLRLSDWFVSTLFPQLPWHEQLAVSLMMPAKIDDAEKLVYDILSGSGLISSDGEINIEEARKRIEDMMFRSRDYFSLKISTTEFKIRKENLREILQEAR